MPLIIIILYTLRLWQVSPSGYLFSIIIIIRVRTRADVRVRKILLGRYCVSISHVMYIYCIYLFSYFFTSMDVYSNYTTVSRYTSDDIHALGHSIVSRPVLAAPPMIIFSVWDGTYRIIYIIYTLPATINYVNNARWVRIVMYVVITIMLVHYARLC